MNALKRHLRDDSGQVLVFVVVLLTVLLGMAALVIDGGSWWQAQRHLQTAADAGALAGAQNLPNDQARASADAISFAQQNFSGLDAPTVTFPSAGEIDVTADTTAPGFLAKIFGTAFGNVNVRAHARAAVGVPALLQNVAPVAVSASVACAVTNPDCYGERVTLDFGDSQVSSSTIGLIDVTCHSSQLTPCGSHGGPGASDLKDWIENGYDQPLPANQWYDVKTGVTEGPIEAGFKDRIGVPLFFPVFDEAASSGGHNNDWFFHIIGWAAFVIDRNGVNWGSQTRELTGHFVTYIATDLAAGGTLPDATDFGVHVINLTQ